MTLIKDLMLLSEAKKPKRSRDEIIAALAKSTGVRVGEISQLIDGSEHNNTNILRKWARDGWDADGSWKVNKDWWAKHGIDKKEFDLIVNVDVNESAQLDEDSEYDKSKGGQISRAAANFNDDLHEIGDAIIALTKKVKSKQQSLLNYAKKKGGTEKVSKLIESAKTVNENLESVFDYFYDNDDEFGKN